MRCCSRWRGPHEHALAPGALARYQDAFAAALLADDPLAEAAPELRPLVSQPGFAVYRNTVMKGCVDALQANYPTIERLVGEEWFRAAAACHARKALPSQTALIVYGEAFADFLATFEPARELPYLADVARVDRAWTEAHVAADAPTLAPAELAALPPAQMSTRALRCTRRRAGAGAMNGRSTRCGAVTAATRHRPATSNGSAKACC